MHLEEIHCSQCGQIKQVGVFGTNEPKVCGECQIKNSKKEREDFIEQFANVSIDKAIEKLAEMVYEIKISQDNSKVSDLMG